jgi:hypothetical protein
MDNQSGLYILSSLLGKLGIPNRVLLPNQNQSNGIDVNSLHKLFLPSSITDQQTTRTIMLSPASLDETYHYDFTDISDNGVTFYRGGMIYNRPCGWKRYAFDLKGKYPDDIWLNGKHPRKDIYSSAEGEWPVSYHGTSLHNGLSIEEEGYKLCKGERNLYGNGIYSTPDINVALLYADTTEEKGRNRKKFKVILQNRVNPKTLQKVSKAENDVGEYWISPNEDDIRPYGFCVKVY